MDSFSPPGSPGGGRLATATAAAAQPSGLQGAAQRLPDRNTIFLSIHHVVSAEGRVIYFLEKTRWESRLIGANWRIETQLKLFWIPNLIL